jgi:hypothetical protein
MAIEVGKLADAAEQLAQISSLAPDVPVDPVRGRHARTVPQRGAPVGYDRDETATTP